MERNILEYYELFVALEVLEELFVEDELEEPEELLVEDEPEELLVEDEPEELLVEELEEELGG